MQMRELVETASRADNNYGLVADCCFYTFAGQVDEKVVDMPVMRCAVEAIQLVLLFNPQTVFDSFCVDPDVENDGEISKWGQCVDVLSGCVLSRFAGESDGTDFGRVPLYFELTQLWQADELYELLVWVVLICQMHEEDMPLVMVMSATYDSI